MELVPRVEGCEFSMGAFFFFFVAALASSLGEARSRAAATKIILLNICLPSKFSGRIRSQHPASPELWRAAYWSCENRHSAMPILQLTSSAFAAASTAAIRFGSSLAPDFSSRARIAGSSTSAACTVKWMPAAARLTMRDFSDALPRLSSNLI